MAVTGSMAGDHACALCAQSVQRIQFCYKGVEKMVGGNKAGKALYHSLPSSPLYISVISFLNQDSVCRARN